MKLIAWWYALGGARVEKEIVSEWHAARVPAWRKAIDEAADKAEDTTIYLPVPGLHNAGARAMGDWGEPFVDLVNDGVKNVDSPSDLLDLLYMADGHAESKDLTTTLRMIAVRNIAARKWTFKDLANAAIERSGLSDDGCFERLENFEAFEACRWMCEIARIADMLVPDTM